MGKQATDEYLTSPAFVAFANLLDQKIHGLATPCAGVQPDFLHRSFGFVGVAHESQNLSSGGKKTAALDGFFLTFTLLILIISSAQQARQHQKNEESCARTRKSIPRKSKNKRAITNDTYDDSLVVSDDDVSTDYVQGAPLADKTTWKEKAEQLAIRDTQPARTKRVGKNGI